MMEWRHVVIYMDRKQLTFAFPKQNENSSPRQQKHLKYILKFTTDIRHIAEINNVAVDAFSRISEIQVPDIIKYLDMSKDQNDDQELRLLQKSGNSLKMVPLEISHSKLKL